MRLVGVIQARIFGFLGVKVSVESMRLLADLGDEVTLQKGVEVLGIVGLGFGVELVVHNVFDRAAFHCVGWGMFAFRKCRFIGAQTSWFFGSDVDAATAIDLCRRQEGGIQRKPGGFREWLKKGAQPDVQAFMCEGEEASRAALDAKSVSRTGTVVASTKMKLHNQGPGATAMNECEGVLYCAEMVLLAKIQQKQGRRGRPLKASVSGGVQVEHLGNGLDGRI